MISKKPQAPPNLTGTVTEWSFKQALPQLLAVSVKNLLLLGYGMTLGFPTIVIPNLHGGPDARPGELVLTSNQLSWISSINYICVPLGCVLSGAVTQPLGRRRAMQFVNAPFLAAWLLFHFAWRVEFLYIALALTGLGGGLMEAPVITYVAEITQPHLRGILSATSSMCVILGVFTQFLLGALLQQSWRTVALINLAFPVIATIALFFVPESPHWLISRKRFDDARSALAWLRGWCPIEDIEEEFKELCRVLRKNPNGTNTKKTSQNGKNKMYEVENGQVFAGCGNESKDIGSNPKMIEKVNGNSKVQNDDSMENKAGVDNNAFDETCNDNKPKEVSTISGEVSKMKNGVENVAFDGNVNEKDKGPPYDLCNIPGSNGVQKTTEKHISDAPSEKYAFFKSYKNYFKRTFMLPYALVCFAFYLGHFSGMTTLQTFAVEIFETLKAPINKYYATLILGIVELLGTLLCVILIHYTGKRILSFISTFGCGVCFFIVATYAYMLQNNESIINNNSTETFELTNHTMASLVDQKNENEFEWVPMIFLILSAFLSHVGIRLLPWVLIGEVFPNETRAGASGLSGGMGYILGFIANKTYYHMIQTFSIPGTFWFYAFNSLVGMIILFFVLPETEGKPLHEIEDHFAGRMKTDNKVRRLVGQKENSKMVELGCEKNVPIVNSETFESRL